MAFEMIEKFFRPNSVALIGATGSPGFGYGIPILWKKNGWLDRAFLVNPRGGKLHGQEVYPRVSDLPEGIDLAVVIVPADGVKGVLTELGKKGVRAVVIESAGFAETGEAGRRKQEELLEVARGLGMRLIGPNCVGIVNTENRMTTIEVLDGSLEPGNVAMIAQSGVFGNILLDHLPEAGLKISKVVTLGNKIDLDEADFLDYLAGDVQTRVIVIYLEGVKDGRRLLEALRRTCRQKPVIILKSGRTPLGRLATLSHTASLSGEDRIYEAAFHQAGAIRAASLAEMIETARVFSAQPPLRGRKIGVLTTSGSLGALVADALYSNGLELAAWSGETVEKIRTAAPGWVNVKNPLDVGPSGIFPLALQTIASDPNPDGFILIPVYPYAVVEIWMKLNLPVQAALGEWQDCLSKAGKPALMMELGSRQWLEKLRELGGAVVSPVSSPEAAARTLAASLSFYGSRLNFSREEFDKA